MIDRGCSPQQIRGRALAEFGRRALLHDDLDAILQEACLQVAQGVGVPIAKIAVKLDHSDDLLLKDCVGLPTYLAMAGVTKVPGGKGSAVGYTLLVDAPVISDVDTETRFEPSEVVRRSGVKTSANVVLWVEGKPYGALEADSTVEWKVTDDDIDFLRNYESLVSAAIQKHNSTTKLRLLHQERQVLLNEIFHRIKNLLANVLAIARRTATHSKNLQEFSSAFEGRIGALSRAHDLLLTAPDQPGQLRELLALEFKAKALEEGKQFHISGPDLLCEPKTMQILALLVFELATNAVKYGALSRFATPAARIDVSWTVDRTKNEVSFRWREKGVALQKSTRRGFGSELISREVPQMLSGDAEILTHDDGIECVLRFPLPEASGVLSIPLQPADF
jgi:two-component sensor histidine kinase